MLGTVTIALEAQNRSSLPAFPGRYLHAALFSILSHVDADEATWWHDMEGIKPFSLQLSLKSLVKIISFEVGISYIYMFLYGIVSYGAY